MAMSGSNPPPIWAYRYERIVRCAIASYDYTWFNLVYMAGYTTANALITLSMLVLHASSNLWPVTIYDTCIYTNATF
jgi:hypothetical protein